MHQRRGEHVTLLHFRGEITPIIMFRDPVILQRVQVSLATGCFDQRTRDQQIVITCHDLSSHIRHFKTGFLYKTEIVYPCFILLIRKINTRHTHVQVTAIHICPVNPVICRFVVALDIPETTIPQVHLRQLHVPSRRRLRNGINFHG